MKMNKVKWYFDNDDVVFDGNHLQDSKGSGIFVNEKTHLLVVDFLASIFHDLETDIASPKVKSTLPKCLYSLSLWAAKDLYCSSAGSLSST